MIKNATIIDNQTRPVFSGHETFPMRYGWLKKIIDVAESLEKQGNTTIKSFLTSDKAMVELGVGKNMVASMRHWALYAGVFDVNDTRELRVNDFARWLIGSSGVDHWLENYATLWYIHWNLVCGKRTSGECLFTYYWFFNHYNFARFDKDILVKQIGAFLKENVGAGKMPAPLTLGRDIDCFISIYAAKARKSKSDEEAIESPLVELGLISPISRRDVFQINRGVKPSLSIYTFLFGLLMFWKEYSPKAKTMSFESICYQPMSPGRVFLINEDAVAGFMHAISKTTGGLFEYSETAGMKEIILSKDIDFEAVAYEYFKRNY